MANASLQEAVAASPAPALGDAEESFESPVAPAAMQEKAAQGVPAATPATQDAPEDKQDEKQDEKKTDPMVRCRRCATEVKASEAVEMPKFRLEFRYTCKPCWALNTQMNRHGIEIGKALTEEDAIAFFVEAKEQRLNGSENRLAYHDARALLKQKMVVAASRIDSHGEDGEWQPITYWELRGYDTAKILELADERDHPILGKTYRIDISKQSTHHIHKTTEERLLNMESAAMERKKAAAAAASDSKTAPSAPDLDIPILVEAASSSKNKRKTPEEKAAAQEQAKAQRAEDKKRRKLETTACSAAAKLLPQLKKGLEKLRAAVDKTKAVVTVSLSADDDRTIGQAAEALENAISTSTSLLGDSAKGKSLAELSASDLLNEKELQRIVKDGNNAIRVAQSFVRQNKENTAAAKQSQGRGKK